MTQYFANNKRKTSFKATKNERLFTLIISKLHTKLI